MPMNMLCIQLYLRGLKSKLMQFQWSQGWWNWTSFHQIWICSVTCFSPFASHWLCSAQWCQSSVSHQCFWCLSTKRFYQKLFSVSSHRALANATSSKWVCHSHCTGLVKWRVAREYVQLWSIYFLYLRLNRCKNFWENSALSYINYICLDRWSVAWQQTLLFCSCQGIKAYNILLNSNI